MANTKKCPECNGCMAKFWILPNRYYFCEFCRVYYAGMDTALYVIPSPYIKETEENSE